MLIKLKRTAAILMALTGTGYAAYRLLAPDEIPQGATISAAPSKPPDEFYEEPGLTKKGLQIRLSRAYRDHLLQDKGVLLENIRTERVPLQGELIGYSLQRIRANSFYWKIGLWQDDVLTKVGDQPLADVEQQAGIVARLEQVIAQDQPTTIRVLRGDQPLNFEIINDK